MVVKVAGKFFHVLAWCDLRVFLLHLTIHYGCLGRRDEVIFFHSYDDVHFSVSKKSLEVP